MTNATSFGSNLFGFLEHTTSLLVDSIEKLASQAGILLTHLWIVFTRQQLIIGVQQMLIGLSMLTGAFISYRWFSKWLKDDKMAKLDKYFLLAITFGLTLWLLVHGLQNSIDSLPRIINPEYYAIQESVKLLKEVKP